MTNGDKIRQMSDSELAHFIATDECRQIMGNIRIFPYSYSLDEILKLRTENIFEWLKQEVAEWQKNS